MHLHPASLLIPAAVLVPNLAFLVFPPANVEKLLAFYYAGWSRYFVEGRDSALLFEPMLGLPIPMAVCPVISFLIASVVLGSIYQAIAATVLAVGHITISADEYLRVARR
jgi:hypothetical protein